MSQAPSTGWASKKGRGNQKRKVLITGGSGFLGRHLVKKLLDKYEDLEVSAIARSGEGIIRLLSVCPSDRFEPIIGDVRDEEILQFALKDIDTVVHLAAMKYINLCELSPSEAISINVHATTSLLKLFKGNTFISMSTDKAVESSSCYGATKLIVEKMTLAEADKNTNKRFMVVRSGNIFGSTGSVIENWHRQIKRNNEITVSNPEMTRFFINVDELAEYIITILENGESGKIYIPPQRVIQIGDLAQAFIELYGNKTTMMKVVGQFQGEKMHEKLFMPGEDVVTDMMHRTSEQGKKLSLDEIKTWLQRHAADKDF
ncbi:MAG: polysaccharide biosynthesis protein [Chloroflexota bacterium]|nr:polysaccharide biosynthesis protein [Chloroflexota bacterium]